MKSVIAKVAVLVAAGLVVLSAAMPEPVMRMNIPFTFLAGGQMHRAGLYWVRVNSAPCFVELRPLKSAIVERLAVNGTCISRNGPERTDPMKGFLRFERYGSTYALRAAGAPGIEDGLGLKPSEVEKELAEANNGAAGSEVSVIQ
jgi:hypothetical protein